MVSEEEDK